MASIEWKPKALKQAMKIDRQMQPKLHKAVSKLADWPDCKNVKALVGRDDYRLRVGRYRVIFQVIDGNPIVIKIEEVKKRDERTY